MELFIDKANPLDETLKTQELLGKRVITKSGTVLGRVKAIHISKKNYCVQGIVVKKFFRKDKYICITYIHAITLKAIILSIDPVTLFVGCKVISHDGKKIGTVKKVHRIDRTNHISSLTVRCGWFKTINVRHVNIEHLGNSVIISKTYEQIKND